MGDFEEQTRVVGGAGRYRAEIHRDWEIWGPNGGYLAAIALRAAGAEARISRPVSFAVHYLGVARFNAVDIEVEVVHGGKRAESIRVSVKQGERKILEGLLRTAATGPGLSHDRRPAPDVAPPNALLERRELNDEEHYPKFWNNFMYKPVDQAFWKEPRPIREPHLQDWLRFSPTATFSDPFVEAGRSLLLVDTMFWPAARRHHRDESFVAPSLDVATWFHRPPRSEWLLCDAYVPIGEEGLLSGHAHIFNEVGDLVASGGSQMLCMPAP